MRWKNKHMKKERPLKNIITGYNISVYDNTNRQVVGVALFDEVQRDLLSPFPNFNCHRTFRKLLAFRKMMDLTDMNRMFV